MSDFDTAELQMRAANRMRMIASMEDYFRGRPSKPERPDLTRNQVIWCWENIPSFKPVPPARAKEREK
jgi:hypothetical protein